MRTKHIFLIGWIGVAFSCNKAAKDVKDYYPRVSTSAIVLDDGSVEVTGIIEYEGIGDLSAAGFCMDTADNPHMTRNQVQAGSGFKAIYKGFDNEKTYYFRSWVTNEYGYAYGNTVSLSKIAPKKVDAPCSPPANTIENGFTGPQTIYGAYGPNNSGNFWTMTASAPGNSLTMEFGEKPITKVYTAVSTTSAVGRDEVRFYFNGGSQGALRPGQKVYVEKLSDTEWRVITCAAEWGWNGGTLYYTMNIKVPS